MSHEGAEVSAGREDSDITRAKEPAWKHRAGDCEVENRPGDPDRAWHAGREEAIHPEPCRLDRGGRQESEDQGRLLRSGRGCCL